LFLLVVVTHRVSELGLKTIICNLAIMQFLFQSLKLKVIARHRDRARHTF
jgi:hypothetical protein